MDEGREFRERWVALWDGSKSPDGVWVMLLSRYDEGGRAYHNHRHILACLQEWDGYCAATGAARKFALGAAIFFHDAIYDPQRHDNEAASAKLAQQALSAMVSADEMGDITRLIMTTEHKVAPTKSDEALMVDIDLSILGQPTLAFDAYETAIRLEYAHVPEEAFRKGRAGVLRRFLARERIFATEHFHGQYERQARVNLARSISQLETGIRLPQD